MIHIVNWLTLVFISSYNTYKKMKNLPDHMTASPSFQLFYLLCGLDGELTLQNGSYLSCQPHPTIQEALHCCILDIS